MFENLLVNKKKLITTFKFIQQLTKKEKVTSLHSEKETFVSVRSNGNEKDLLITDVMPTTSPLNTTNFTGTSSRELIDLEVIVLNWAKQIFGVTKTKSEAKINKKFLQVLSLLYLFLLLLAIQKKKCTEQFYIYFSIFSYFSIVKIQISF